MGEATTFLVVGDFGGYCLTGSPALDTYDSFHTRLKFAMNSVKQSWYRRENGWLKNLYVFSEFDNIASKETTFHSINECKSK